MPSRGCPSWSEAHLQLGFAYASANRREEAVRYYNQVFELQPADIDTWGGVREVKVGRNEDGG
jgi:tetratricopeptide (TPR) repeat protein